MNPGMRGASAGLRNYSIVLTDDSSQGTSATAADDLITGRKPV
jgi:hypothetical protein